MKVTAIVPWFGSKRNLAPEIAAEFGPHAAYWDLFCGSMAVLLAKERATMETVNDLHGDLVNLARVIVHPRLGPVLYRQLRRTLAAKKMFDEAAERFRERGNRPAGEEPDIERAYDYFFASWMGRNGTAGTSSYNQGFCRRFTKNGGAPATRWTNAVQSIPAWRRRLRAVTILSEDGISLAERIEDSPGVVIYADPPYLVKGAKYVHDFVPEDHERLATALHRFKHTRVIVSYYDHPDLKDLYPGWTLRHLKATKAMVNQGARDSGGAVEAPEVLLINGPSFVEQQEASLF